MKNLFDPREAKTSIRAYPSIPEPLALRVYTSRLIGRNPNLVLHGGGNTSVKLKVKNIIGEERDVLYVKGSGVDLSTIEPEGFSGLDLHALRKLRALESISDEEMNNELEIYKMSAMSPTPSVEALVHAFLPHRYVDHTHADGILLLTHQENGEEAIREALGPRVSILSYIRSGLPLGKQLIDRYERDPDVEAIVVLDHGIFTFGGDAETSYGRMIACVSKAESYVKRKTRRKTSLPPRPDLIRPKGVTIPVARFTQAARGACAHRDPQGDLRRFYVEIRKARDLVDASLSKEIGGICESGVLTPDHVIWTKNWAVPIGSIPEGDEELKRTVRETVETYCERYERYVTAHAESRGASVRPLDPYPRVFLVAGLGLVALGFTRRAARIAADIAEHTIRVKLQAFALGSYEPIAEQHVFDMEYWGLQQKKLGSGSPPPLQGQIALITGSGGVLGFGIADRLLAAGAVVVISDIDTGRLERVHHLLAERYDESRVESVPMDVRSFRSVEKALEAISWRLGGIDILVPNAGIAQVARIEDLSPRVLDQVIAVNLKGTFHVIKAAVPVFRRQGTGGNIVVVSSKNVFDPGAAFGAYSASKAGAHQISKIAALELAELGVRVNMVNPDAVFGDERVSSKLWDLVGAERMRSRGLDPEGLREYYRQRSLLKVPVLAEHVGNAVVFFATEQTPTTGATLPIDGGIPGAFPR